MAQIFGKERGGLVSGLDTDFTVRDYGKWEQLSFCPHFDDDGKSLLSLSEAIPNTHAGT